MTDVRDDLRELLRRRADQVPPQRTVPASLGGRARRRIALNAVAVGLAAVVVAGGAFAGIRALGAAPAGGPAGQPSNSPASPPGPAVAACTSLDLRAISTMEGAAGSRVGGITMQNWSDHTCTLQGVPAITLLDQGGQPITSGIDVSATPAQWQVDQSPEPAGWPVVTLHPGDSASVRIRWSNWCPDGRATPQWNIGISGEGTVVVEGMDSSGPPPCNGQGLPSTIEVGPFEPNASQ